MKLFQINHHLNLKSIHIVVYLNQKKLMLKKQKIFLRLQFIIKLHQQLLFQHHHHLQNQFRLFLIPKLIKRKCKQKQLFKDLLKVCFFSSLNSTFFFKIGPINIDECSPDGKYIQLANTSKNKDIDLTGWRLLRKVDNSPEITYSIPSNFKLASGKYVKIHAKGQAKERPPFDLVLPTHDSWGVGVSVVTRLLNEQNEEKATHIQKTVYAN